MAAWPVIRKTRTSHIGGEPRRARTQNPNLQIIKQHRKVRSASARLYAAEVQATYRRSHARLSAAGIATPEASHALLAVAPRSSQGELPIMNSRLDRGGDFTCAPSDFSATLLS